MRIDVPDSVYRDIDRISRYIERDNPPASIRFMKNVTATIAGLRTMPERWGRHDTSDPELQSVRIAPIKKYPKIYVLFRVLADRIEVIAVLHSSQDLDYILTRRLSG